MVSIIIPTFNYAEFIGDAIHSVKAQTLGDWECIIIDDCSTDDTVHVVEKLVEGDNRFRYICLEQNSGVSAARNRGLKECKGKYIQFLDADDVLAPFALDALRRAGDMPESIHVLAGGCHRIIDGAYRDYLKDSEQSLARILESNPLLPSAVFVRRSALIEVGLFDERIDFEEDWDLWLRLHERYGLEAFAVVDRPVCYYWINEAERRKKVRNGTVDGVPVRDYFRQRYGANPR